MVADLTDGDKANGNNLVVGFSHKRDGILVVKQPGKSVKGHRIVGLGKHIRPVPAVQGMNLPHQRTYAKVVTQPYIPNLYRHR